MILEISDAKKKLVQNVQSTQNFWYYACKSIIRNGGGCHNFGKKKVKVIQVHQIESQYKSC